MIPNLTVESGSCTAWNCTIEEQECFKFGSVCSIHVRGRISSGYLTYGTSLFSLPWYPRNKNSHSDFGVLVLVDQSTCSEVVVLNNYNGTYNVVSLSHVSNVSSSQDFFIFHATYISS